MSINKSLKSIALLLVLIMVFSVVGCTQKPVEDANENNNSDLVENPIEDEVIVESTEIVIVDHLGREVRFEEPVETIVSGYYISSSILLALDLQDKIVGIEAKPEKRPIYEIAAPELLELPTVGTMKEFDLEATAALNPDLVILSVRLKDSAESLEKLGIKVIAINPESMEELEEALMMIGKATGREDRAKALKEYYDNKLEELNKIWEGKEAKNIYLGGNSDYLSTASKKMYQDTLINNAGGKNVAADIDDTYWATISYEQLIQYNPDVIIGAAGAAYTADDIKNDDKLQSIKAVENGEVYIIPSAFELWDSPIPSGIIGTMWLTSVLYEEDYPFEKFKADTYDFYKEFYGVEIDKEKITK